MALDFAISNIFTGDADADAAVDVDVDGVSVLFWGVVLHAQRLRAITSTRTTAIIFFIFITFPF